MNRRGVAAQRRSPHLARRLAELALHLIVNITMEGEALRRLSNAARSQRSTSATPITALLRSQGTYGRCGGVGRGLGVGVALGAGVDVGVAVAVAVAVAVGVGVGVGVPPPPGKG
jgi:hypothetical protein